MYDYFVLAIYATQPKEHIFNELWNRTSKSERVDVEMKTQLE